MELHKLANIWDVGEAGKGIVTNRGKSDKMVWSIDIENPRNLETRVCDTLSRQVEVGSGRLDSEGKLRSESFNYRVP
jgi:hypothetical protein